MAGSEAEKAAREAEAAMESEAGLLAGLDPLTFGQTLARTALGLASNPQGAWEAASRYTTGLIAGGSATMAHVLGSTTEGPIADGDRRFDDPAWSLNPAFFGLRQAYGLWTRLLDDLADAARLDERSSERAHFALGLIGDALAPTNYLLTNPKALKRAFETGGASVVRGFRHFLEDVATNDGMPRQVDRSPFTLGENLAATPGKVVFRNRLIELIQYAPQTEEVHAVPMLFSPPWINKYYVMDLAPGKSFTEWAVKHGHTVFSISYRNPDESMRDVTFDEYLLQGPLAALDVVRAVTRAPKVNVVGLCLGGTMTAMMLSHLAARGEDRVSSATLLNTLTDFSDPGPLALFTDRQSVRQLEQKMWKRGYLDGAEMARTFNFLRANDLVWNYVASNWLMGEDPPAFDILAWNADSTRMPAAMHSQYLHACYLDNAFARGELELGGVRLDPGAIDVPLYIVGAEVDHIAPWKGCYLTTQLVKGETRFVLTSSGHIAGIVNPPGGKRRYWASADGAPTDPDAWRERAEEHGGSWWEDWADWIGARAGGRGKPPALGNKKHKPLEDAPGSYVRG
jgi:poly[(R)-3-hydroxyalkanoate] polymerase subunit PhaC